MYHIKDDKRSKSSARLISDGLMRCLERKSLSQITITDVQKESCVGRATIYRLFDNLPDVLAYQCDSVFDELFQKHKAEKTAEESFVTFAEHWMLHYKLLDTIVESNHIDILYESLKKNAGKLREFFYPDSGIDALQMEYIAAMLTSLMTGTLMIWARNGRKETARELFGIVREASLLIYESFIKDL